MNFSDPYINHNAQVILKSVRAGLETSELDQLTQLLDRAAQVAVFQEVAPGDHLELAGIITRQPELTQEWIAEKYPNAKPAAEEALVKLLLKLSTI